MAVDHRLLSSTLVVCLAVLCGAATGADVAYVGQLKATDQERSGNSFDTIDELVDRGVQNSTSIILLDNVTQVSTTLTFLDVHDIAITGNDTRVYCKGNNSGLVFRRVSNIQIREVSFLNCGSIQDSTSTDFRDASRSATLEMKSALYFHYCTNISVISATFENNTGIAVVIYNSNGTVVISDCTFTGNRLAPEDSKMYGGGGGVHIECSSCFVSASNPSNVPYYGADSFYQIQQCTFDSNVASTLLTEVSSYSLAPGDRQGLGRGGGVYIGIGGSASNVKVIVSDCNYTRNSAVFGGGIFVSMEDSARDNTVTVQDCNVTDNHAQESGGGAYMSYSSRSGEMQNNAYITTGTTFQNNKAEEHGGMHFVDRGIVSSNIAQIVRCEWAENSAVYGAALGIVSQSRQNCEKQGIEIESCTFLKNSVVSKELDYIEGVSNSREGKAVVTVSFEHIIFRGRTVFEENAGTALWVINSVIKFPPFSIARFANNSSEQGGAMSLTGSSIMLVSNNSEFIFQSNSATLYGGAMYLKSHNEQNPYSEVESVCPLQYQGEYDERESNVSFHFINNTAGKGGDAIYFTTLDSCVFLCTHNTSAERTVENVFKCIGKMHSEDSRNGSIPFSTFNYDFSIPPNSSYLTDQTIFATPGKQFELSVDVVDQLKNPLRAVFTAEIEPPNSIVIDRASKCVSDRVLRVYGSPHSRGILKLVNDGFFRFLIRLNISLLSCPPAYRPTNITVNSVTVESCICGNYKGIYCGTNPEMLNTYLVHGYWAGYISTTKGNSGNFFTYRCPLGYCDYFNKTHFTRYYLIPSTGTKNVGREMEEFICGPARRGVLCGECRANRSVYFHSPEYKCYPDRLCSYGWLFYILSELMPVAILFASVMLFNISFTSGSISGFVLFAQSVDLVAYATRRYNQSSKVISYLASIHEVIYSFFNLNFFGINSFSYCLFRGANALDIIAIKYATVAFALVLVAVTILAMKQRFVACKFPARLLKVSAVTHGLSAFLILCYTQCTQASFRLLSTVRLYGTNTSQLHIYHNGEIILFSLAHLPYAIPALFCLFLIVIPPPLILLWQPLGKQLLSCCGLGESVLVRVVDKILLVNKLKPVLDSFQGCFKDNRRYFAGLHFVYRLSLLLTVLFASGSQFYIWLSIHSAMMLLAYTTLQPYKKNLHNVTDGLLLAILLFINIISLSINVRMTIQEDNNIEHHIAIASISQLLLLYAPILCAIGWLTIAIVRYIWRRRAAVNQDLDLSYRLVRSSSNGISMSLIQHD
jgi:hypothetical protein